MAENTLDELSSLPVDYRRHPMAMGMGQQQVQPMQTPEWLVEGMGNVNLGAAPPRSRSYRGGGGDAASMPDMTLAEDGLPLESEIQGHVEQHNIEERLGMSTEGGMSMETLPPAQMPQIGGTEPGAPPALTPPPELVDPTPYFLNQARQYEDLGKNALDAMKAADEKLAESEDKYNKRVLRVQQQQKRFQEQAATDMQNQQKIDADSREAARRKIERATQMVMDKTIDTRRLLPSLSSKMGAALAVGLGQFGATLTGTQNAALQILETAIDRDIAAQQVDIENLKFGVQMAQSDYSMLLDEIQDRRQVNNVIRQLGYQQFDTMLSQMETKYNIDSKDSRIAKLRAATQAEKAKLNLEFIQMHYAAAYQSYVHNSMIEAQKAQQASQRATLEFSRPIQEKLTYASLADGLILELEQLIPETHAAGGLWPFYNESEKYQDNLKGLASNLVRMYSGAAATDTEAQRIADRLGGYFTTQETKEQKLAEIQMEMQVLKAALYDSMSPEEQALYYGRFGDPRVNLKSSDQQKLKLIKSLVAGERMEISTPTAAVAAVVGPAE